MKTRIAILFIFILVSASALSAQMSGVYSIPGAYATVAAAVSALNAAGVGEGGVTFNVAAGHTETLSAAINLTATGYSTRTIVFQKDGTGTNPLITAYPGTSDNASTPDGIWILSGCDYVTIDGIDLYDPNTENTTAMMEFGYGLFIDSSNFGSQHNTIQCCTIYLNRYNDSYNTLTQVRGSVGILVLNSLLSSAQTEFFSYSEVLSNSFNKLYGNTINNSSIGILLRGFNSSVPYVAVNRGNDIGGNSPSTGNHVLNFGGGNTTNPAYGIRSYYQWDFTISYNTIDNNTGSGVDHTHILYGIETFGAPNTNVTISHNSISLKSASTTSNVYCINNMAGSASTINTVDLTYNHIYDCTYSVANSGLFHAITNQSAAGIVNITNNIIENCFQISCLNFKAINNLHGHINNINDNIIRDISFTGNTCYAYLINPVTSDNTVTGNEIHNISANLLTTSSSFLIYGITCNPNSTSNAGNYSENVIRNISIYGTTSSMVSTIAGIRLSTVATDAETQVYDNQIYDFNYYPDVNPGTAILCGIYTSHGINNIARNKIFDFMAKGNGSSIRAIDCNNGTDYIYNNMIYDLTTENSFLSPSTAAIECNSNCHVSYNTVYLSAIGQNNEFSTATVELNTTPTILKNNIFVNKSIHGTYGYTVLIWSYNFDNSVVGAGSDNNIYFAGTPSTRNLIGYFGSTGYQTMTDYKTFMVDKEQNSMTEDVPFVSVSSPFDLHIDNHILTSADGNAIPIAEITSDFDNQPRDLFNPDIGADEFVYTPPPDPPSAPVCLSPENGATLVSLDAALSWTAGGTGGSPDSYDVYFGTTNPPPFVENTTSETYEPELDYQTAYYWKIVAINYSGEAAGPVWSFSTEIDYKITALPHCQNFDAVTAPDLPGGWSKLTAPGTSIQTGTAHYVTAPNSVIFALMTEDASVTPPLISPQITVGIENIRMSFMAKWIGNSASVIVGTMTDPEDIYTFTSFTALGLTSSYEQYIVDLSTYTGTDQYLAFRLSSMNLNVSISLDTLLLQQAQPENDLAVLYMTGSTLGFPSFSVTQTITVENRGTAPQSSYTIRVMSTNGPTVLKTQNYTIPLEPGQAYVFNLNWVPQLEGTYFIYGEVVLTNDENNANNSSTTRQVNVYTWTTYGAVVGEDGSPTAANYLPFCFSFRTSLSETIYTATEMQMQSGFIEGIIYESNFIQDIIETPVKLWMKNTTAADLTAGWLDFSGYSLVFDGLVSIMSGEYNYVHFPLSTPFEYTGGSLAIRASRPMDSQSYVEGNAFYYTDPIYVENRSRYLLSNPDEINPANPFDTGELTSHIPVTIFVAPVATPVVLTPPLVSISVLGSDLVLAWDDVPGAYCYRVYCSDYPHSWPEVPDAVVHTNSYVITSPSESKKFFRVVAASTYK